MASEIKKVAVVTGGAKRIGRAIACHLHQLGFDIALHYRSSLSAAETLAAELCEQREGSCKLYRADLEDLAQVRALAAEITDSYACIDLLVNNASGFSPTPIESCTPEQFDGMLGSNLRAPFFLIQGLLPAMQSGRAAIVNMLDIHAERPLGSYSAYCAAKAGMTSLTRSLALELAPTIRVNGIAPGAILWPEEGDAYDQSMREDTLDATPLKRLGQPMDIARTVGFLACDAPYITGQVIVVDGGSSLTT
jgi:pteridine reductase